MQIRSAVVTVMGAAAVASSPSVQGVMLKGKTMSIAERIRMLEKQNFELKPKDEHEKIQKKKRDIKKKQEKPTDQGSSKKTSKNPTGTPGGQDKLEKKDDAEDRFQTQTKAIVKNKVGKIKGTPRQPRKKFAFSPDSDDEESMNKTHENTDNVEQRNESVHGGASIVNSDSQNENHSDSVDDVDGDEAGTEDTGCSLGCGIFSCFEGNGKHEPEDEETTVEEMFQEKDESETEIVETVSLRDPSGLELAREAESNRLEALKTERKAREMIRARANQSDTDFYKLSPTSSEDQDDGPSGLELAREAESNRLEALKTERKAREMIRARANQSDADFYKDAM